MADKIIISPNTKEIATTAHALSMKNELIGFGVTFPEFCGAMKIHYKEYLTTEAKSKLKGWWLTRVKDERMNAQVKGLIKQLKGKL